VRGLTPPAATDGRCAGDSGASTVARVALVYPSLRFDPGRDVFVVWVRWVSFEAPPSPEDPPAQGVRVELMLNRNTVLGPTIVHRRDLAAPVFMQAARARVGEVVRSAARTSGRLDVQLVIHGSIAHAPWAGLYALRDHDGEAIGAGELPGTPLLQVQPSTPADRWHVAGQANLRVTLELEDDRRHLRVLS
jgi:hypothetical protein